MFKIKTSTNGLFGTENKKYHTVFWIILAVFLASLLPLLYIGRYNFPSADDYSNAYKVANIVREGYSPIEAIFAAAAQIYQDWQGTFFASLLICFNPTMLNYRVYKFVPIITYSLFIFSTIFFSRKAVRVVDKQDKIVYKILGLAIAFCSIQQVPSPVEGFYWWTGSAIYLMCYCLQMIFLAFFVGFITENKAEVPLVSTLLLSASAFALGGANYATALLNSGFVLMGLLYTGYKKSPKAKWILAMLVCSLWGLKANVFAPGNRIRMSYIPETQEVGIVKVVIESFRQGFLGIIGSVHITVVGFVLLMIPMFYGLVKKTEFQFKYPLLVTAFSICVYSAQYAPLVYTCTYNPGRMKNIMLFMFMWLLMINVFYWVGYIRQRFLKQCDPQTFGKIKKAAECFAAVGLVAGCTAMPSTTIAVKGLLDGTTQEYGNHMASLINQCMDPNVEYPTVAQFLNKPLHLSFYTPEPGDKDFEVRDFALYYGKEKIVILPYEEQK